MGGWEEGANKQPEHRHHWNRDCGSQADMARAALAARTAVYTDKKKGDKMQCTGFH
jgi:hypothetical protein